MRRPVEPQSSPLSPLCSLCSLSSLCSLCSFPPLACVRVAHRTSLRLLLVLLLLAGPVASLCHAARCSLVARVVPREPRWGSLFPGKTYSSLCLSSAHLSFVLPTCVCSSATASPPCHSARLAPLQREARVRRGLHAPPSAAPQSGGQLLGRGNGARERENAFLLLRGRPHTAASARARSGTAEGGDKEILNDLPCPLRALLQSLRRLPANDVRARMERLLSLGNSLKQLSPNLRTRENLVLGCQSVVHVHSDARRDDAGTLRMYYSGHAEALTTKGLLQLLVGGLSGATPEEIERVPLNTMALAGLSHFITPSRMNGFTNILMKMKAQAAAAASADKGKV
ncbi:Fe-S metabolism associated domain-containing protein [Toxoplasma gondii VAND]|uniref:Fe-S metabolism associated domain-containing protein n=1 Tax=Toxoplasma gondii VAND TaxID=933077 RepID=A0A086PGD9_TOXGO|nr:Fe-S metabolism associated domain-containing protein [Toxoplasma gondii VAND]